MHERVLDNQSKAEAKLDRCHRRVDGLIHPARATGVHTLGQWPGVRGGGRAEMDRSGRRQDGLHRTRLAMGEWIL